MLTFNNPCNFHQQDNTSCVSSLAIMFKGLTVRDARSVFRLKGVTVCQ